MFWNEWFQRDWNVLPRWSHGSPSFLDTRPWVRWWQLAGQRSSLRAPGHIYKQTFNDALWLPFYLLFILWKHHCQDSNRESLLLWWVEMTGQTSVNDIWLPFCLVFILWKHFFQNCRIGVLHISRWLARHLSMTFDSYSVCYCIYFLKALLSGLQ